MIFSSFKKKKTYVAVLRFRGGAIQKCFYLVNKTLLKTVIDTVPYQ